MPNPEQAEIIAAPAKARLVVDGGPGTGKTATAAARAIALLGDGMAPNRLCLISFTRAAVEEMRRRLSGLAAPGAPLPLVTTLDSFAWGLRDGEMDGERPVVESYDAAIAETLTRARQRDAHIIGQLAGLDHIIIDETQDLVGERAELVIAIAAGLPPEAGLTILTDEAQAIYGFAGANLSRGLAANFAAETVAQHFIEQESPFILHELKLLHRTGEKKLVRLFKTTRRHALSTPGNPRRKLARMHRVLFWHERRRGRHDVMLILYRSRAEVLHASRAWMRAGKSHRLRLSGLTILPVPWIARLLHDFPYDSLRRETFLDLWRERMGTEAGEEAWTALAGVSSMISLTRLKAALGESEPPLSLSRFDPGAESGPIIGTIHASKGREADRVRLMLPPQPLRRNTRHNDDPDGEARVLFVGATRAKKNLSIGKGLALGARRLKSGRVYIPARQAAHIELGRPGDFDWSAAIEAMAGLAAAGPGAPLGLRYGDNRLTIFLGGKKVGAATPALLKDLREVRGAVSSGFGSFTATFDDLYLLDLGTAVAEGALYLQPIVLGLVEARFG